MVHLKKVRTQYYVENSKPNWNKSIICKRVLTVAIANMCMNGVNGQYVLTGTYSIPLPEVVSLSHSNKLTIYYCTSLITLEYSSNVWFILLLRTIFLAGLSNPVGNGDDGTTEIKINIKYTCVVNFWSDSQSQL